MSAISKGKQVMTWEWVNQVSYLIAMWVAAWVVIWSCLQTLQAQPPSGFLRIWLQLVSYYARYFMLGVAAWSAFQLAFTSQPMGYWLLLLGAVFYLYMSWVEPNVLQVHYKTLTLSTPQQPLVRPVKLAVLGDIHIGLFSGNPHQLVKLVRTLNRLEVDAVLITGDWLYHAGADIIGKMLVLKAINKPCYTVFSQQDINDDKAARLPEFERLRLIEPNNNTLSHALNVLGITVLDNKNLNIEGVNLIGVSTATSVPFSQLLKSDMPNVILTHDSKQIEANPSYLAATDGKKLVIAGQTHGGQVNMPFFTKHMVQASIGTSNHAGLQHRHVNRRHSYQIWTNTGIGMTGLPFRLNCVPCIDVLTLE